MQKDMAVQVTLNGVDKLNPKLREAIGRVNEITARAKLAQDKLKSIAITQNQIRSLDLAREKMRGLGNQIKVAEANAKAAAAQMKIGNATQADLDKATSAVKRLQEEYDRLGRTAMDTRSKLNAKGLTGPLDAQRARLETERKAAMDMIQRQERLQSAQARASAMRSRAGGLAVGGAGAMAAGGAILGGIGSTVSAFAQAETAATGLETAMMDSSGRVSAEFQKINDLAIRLGDRLPGTTADFQDMMTMLNRQGMSAKTILSGTGEAAAYLGVQLKMMPEQAAEFSAKMQDAVRAGPEEMMGVMDVIQRTFYAGVDSGNMLNAFSKVSAGMDILRTKGVEGARALAPLLAMADQSGLVGEASGNALRKVLQLSMNTDKTRAHGLDFTDGKGEHAGLPKLFSELQKLRAFSTEKRLDTIKDIFGNDAETIQMLTMMIEKGQSGYDDMAAKLQGQAELKARVDRSLGTLSNVWESATGTWTNFKAEIGKALAPELKELAAWLGEVSGRMRVWAAENPKTTRFLAILAGVLGVLLVAGGGIALMIAAILIPMAAMTLMAGTLGIALLPMILIIVGIGAAIAVVVAAFIYFREEIAAAWDVFATTWMAIGTWWQQFSFADLGRQVAIGLVTGLRDGLLWVWDAAKAMAGKAVEAVKSALGIHSPSRVFAEIGGHTAAGLVQGIDRGTPAAVSSVRRMAAGITVAGAATLGAGMAVAGTGGPGTAGPGAGGAVSIGPVSIVIQGAGMSAEEIAIAVDKRLRALATQTKTEQQARFFDD